ncbi:MAG TPA: hypothetical protein VN842_01995 [Thermoplasmata archaeon]|nr:hypothetical protein [Thermoplasmata archaeon]
MSLDTACRESAMFSAMLLGAAGGRARKGPPREFFLCENHSQLVSQIDRELIEEGWTSVYAEKLRPLV